MEMFYLLRDASTGEPCDSVALHGVGEIARRMGFTSQLGLVFDKRQGLPVHLW